MADIVEIVAEVDSDDPGYSAYVEYDGIRRAIRFRIHNAYEESDFSNADIENRAVLPEANKKIAARVPKWAELDASKRERLQDAVIYQAAIEGLLSESKPAGEDVEGEAIMRYETLKIADTIMRYEGNINSIIAEVTPKTNVLVGSFAVVNPKKRF